MEGKKCSRSVRKETGKKGCVHLSDCWPTNDCSSQPALTQPPVHLCAKHTLQSVHTYTEERSSRFLSFSCFCCCCCCCEVRHQKKIDELSLTSSLGRLFKERKRAFFRRFLTQVPVLTGQAVSFSLTLCSVYLHLRTLLVTFEEKKS